MAGGTQVRLRNPGYEIFILALSVLSLVNSTAYAGPRRDYRSARPLNVVLIIDTFLRGPLRRLTYRLLRAEQPTLAAAG